MVSPPSVDEQRAELRRTPISADRRHRLLVVGGPAPGPVSAVSLVRALEALGHTVFHLEPSRTSEVLEVPSGSSGSRLRVAAIRPALDTFRPQVLLLCGGGTTLDDAGAAECARRGIVTVAMASSDEDVVDPAGSFDYLVVHSARALERYRAAGVRTAVLLPRGIDRSLALLGDVDAPDVVCIGDAVTCPGGRERLARVAEQHGLRVGVPTQEADAVRSALAGAAVGAIVCVPRHEATEQVLEPGSEAVGYADPDELAGALDAVLGRPDEAEEMRRRAFRRVVTEHLHEHRWLELFATIEADVRSDDPGPGALRAAEIAEVLAVEHPPPRTVLVSGYFGAGNRGDDLLLDALAGGIERELPGAHLVVASKSPDTVMLRQGRPALDRFDLAECDDRAARASAVVIGPGGLWDDYSIRRAGGVAGIVNGARVSPAHLAQLPVLVRAHGGDVHVFGMGAGPLDDDDARAVVRFTGELASSVVVRDERSAELLGGIDGWTAPVTVAPDVCYALELPAPGQSRASDLPYVVVNVRPWAPDPHVARRVLDAVAGVAAELGLAVVGVPMQHQDETTLCGWARTGDHPEVPFSVLSTDAALADVVATLRSAQAVVSMRLHTALLSHRLGVACVGIAYDPKVTAHFEDVGRAGHVVGLPVDVDVLAERLRTAVATDALPGETMRLVADRERRAGAAVRDLAARLGDAPLPGPVVGRVAEGHAFEIVSSRAVPPSPGGAGRDVPAGTRPPRRQRLRRTARRVRRAVVRRLRRSERR